MNEPRLISVVVPAYNEAAGIATAVRAIADVVRSVGVPYEIVVVDDGSRDATFACASAVRADGLPVNVLALSRNFGKEAALLAGLAAARGDAVITMDADLQHPPALIPRMVDAWRRGARVVHAVKRDRGDEPWYAGARARLANALLSRLTGIDLRGASDYKLLDRSVVDVVVGSLTEHGRVYRALVQWLGFEQVRVEFTVAERCAGRTHWSMRALCQLTFDAVFGFTSAPLRLVTWLGSATLVLGLVIGGEALWSWWRGVAVSGFATTIITLLLIGSFVMISLGIIGEYIARIYEELQGRPTYLVERRTGVTADGAHLRAIDADARAFDERAPAVRELTRG